MKITLLTGKTFDIENAFDFDLKVLSAFKYKRLTLRIDTKKAQAVLTMPKFCSKKKAYDFVLSKQDWIIEHLAKIPKTKDFEDGEVFSFLGEQVSICHQKDSKSATYRENDIIYVGGDIVFLHRRVKDYIKNEAKKVAKDAIREADAISYKTSHGNTIPAVDKLNTKVAADKYKDAVLQGVPLN
jgi:predicted metal-dependent hydrolase